MNLNETKKYKINEEDDWAGYFFVDGNIPLQERNAYFKTNKGNRIDIYIKEMVGNEPHIHLRDHSGNICRIKLRKNEYQRDNYEKANGHHLDKKELKAFNEFMHSIIPGATDKSDTQWKMLSMEWNSAWAGNNAGKTSGLVDLNLGCPDYSVILEPNN